VWDAVGDQIAFYYGTDLVEEAVADLRADPMLPTSNHFGVDTFADSVQGTLLFALRPRPGGGRRRVVVVLGCGSVSLDNLTYPMGLLLYDPRNGDPRSLPQRLPVFPNRLRRTSVGLAGPFDEQMVNRARVRLHNMRLAGEVTRFCERAAGQVLDEDFAAPATLSLPTYGHQATRINMGLWSRMFSGGAPPARFVQLHLEAVCTALLAKDLHDPASLVHRVFFEPVTRGAVLAGLDGALACWRLEKLERRLRGMIEDTQPRDGTIFFWGLTDYGRRIPLTLVQDGAALRLAGLDERRQRWDWEFSPDGLISALRGGSLVPSLLTCYTALAFARGVVCVGGYYQAGYLPVMQRGVTDAVGTRDPAAAAVVARVPTGISLAGLQFAVRVLPDGAAIPAGPVEIAGVGGLTESDLSRIESVTVREAHLAAFPETFPHMAPDAVLPDDWIARLTAENGAACPSLIQLSWERRSDR